MTTAGELLNAKTPWQSVLRILYTNGIAVGIRVTAWAKGSPTRAIYYGVARAQAVLSEAVEAIANNGFRSTATGDALTLNVRDVSGITRPGATYATTTIMITNEGGGNYPFGVRELILLNSAKQKQYLNLAPVTIGPLASAVPVQVIALEPGSDSTALPGEIDAFVTSVDGLTISQPSPAIGVDAMSDADLKAAGDARVGFVPTASTIGAGGAPGAYESVARTGPDGKGGVLRPAGTRIAVTRARVLDDGEGGVQVVVADQDGPIEADDLLLVDAAVKAYALPTGAGTAAAVNATALNQTIAYTAYIPESSTADDEAVETAGTAGLVAYFERFRIGGYELAPGVFKLPLDGMRRAIANAITALVGDTVAVTMTSPSTDTLIFDPKGVPVLDGAPTATITRVPDV